MSTADAQSKRLALGFLTVVEHPQYGLFGGYLMLNTAGRPLEFHCTAPIKPNRAQEILYGPTLEAFLYGEQIGQTLDQPGQARPRCWSAPTGSRRWRSANTCRCPWSWCCRPKADRPMPRSTNRAAARQSGRFRARCGPPRAARSWRPFSWPKPPGPARAGRRRPPADRRTAGRAGRVVRSGRAVPAHPRGHRRSPAGSAMSIHWQCASRPSGARQRRSCYDGGCCRTRRQSPSVAAGTIGRLRQPSMPSPGRSMANAQSLAMPAACRPPLRSTSAAAGGLDSHRAAAAAGAEFRLSRSRLQHRRPLRRQRTPTRAAISQRPKPPPSITSTAHQAAGRRHQAGRPAALSLAAVAGIAAGRRLAGVSRSGRSRSSSRASRFCIRVRRRSWPTKWAWARRCRPSRPSGCCCAAARCAACCWSAPSRW